MGHPMYCAVTHSFSETLDPGARSYWPPASLATSQPREVKHMHVCLPQCLAWHNGGGALWSSISTNDWNLDVCFPGVQFPHQTACLSGRKKAGSSPLRDAPCGGFSAAVKEEGTRSGHVASGLQNLRGLCQITAAERVSAWGADCSPWF